VKGEVVQEHQCVGGNVEMWVDVKGYEGKYQVSSLGRVKSVARMRRGKSGSQVFMPERIMALTAKKDTGRTKPYVEVKFRNGGVRTEPCKSFLVHRLVADAFIKQLEPGEQIDHINGIHADNRVENLRVMHYTEHAKLHPMLVTPEAKKEFQKKAQEKLIEKRASGWKASGYARTEQHLEELRQKALNNPQKRDKKSGRFI
jgi:hypothetical protein